MNQMVQLSFSDLQKPEAKPKYCVLDFETGGFDSKVNGLASVAIIQLDENLQEYDRFYFILYEPDKVYEEGALNVNGFTLEQLQRDGLRPETFIPLFHKLIDGLIMVNHNSAFDMAFLRERGWDIQESVCTMENSMKLWPMQKVKLGIVYNRIFGHDFEGAHNALADTEATCEVLRYQVEKDAKYGVAQPIKWDRFKK